MYEDISNAAQTSANTFKDSLQYLVDAQNQQKLLDQQAVTQRYQNLLNQINQQKEPIQQQFAADSQAAYINKMLAGRQINQNLSQMGLSSTGFGIGQQALNETAYGQNLNQLMLQRNQSLLGLQNQAINAAGEYGVNQTQLESNYLGRATDLNKYIAEQTQNQYNNTYSQMLSAKQYQDQLAQLAWENQYKERQLAEQKRQADLTYAASTYGFGDGTTTNDTTTDSNTAAVTNEDNKIVTANKSPMLSSKTASNWLNENISKQVIANKGITVGTLKSALTNAFNKKILTEDDVRKILNTFGLE